MKKVLTVVGGRPQFIKVAPTSKAIRRKFKEVLVHTGQHYDPNLSNVFFKELNIPKPDYNLGVGSGSHGEQTGKILIELEKVLIKEKPNLVLVFGDMNSTLAGALAASKLHIKVAHVEAGIRSYNREMAEEINRLATDQISDLLFCPTKSAVVNLKKEGIFKGVFNTGNVMYDAALANRKKAESKNNILKKMGLEKNSYLYATVHRAENTDDRRNLASIFEAFAQSGETVILPIHPRTKAAIEKHNLDLTGYPNIRLIDPVGYLENIALIINAKKVLTDSGGVQEEAYFFEVPCITLRSDTERIETVQDGWNVLVGANKNKILAAIKNFRPKRKQSHPYGNGHAAEKIVKILEKYV